MGNLSDYARPLLAALATACLAGGAIAQESGIRLIEGSLTGADGASVPASAFVVIEALDEAGRRLGEATFRVRAAEAQVPMQLGIPADVTARLRAAVYSDGRTLSYVPEIAIPAGTETVSLGDVALSAFASPTVTSAFSCGEQRISAGFFPDVAVLYANGDRTILERVRTASGARYDDPANAGTWLWSKGNNALLSLGGQEFQECVVVPPEAPLPYVARGNEPGWSVRIDAGRVAFDIDYGAAKAEAGLPVPGFVDGAFVYDLPSADAALRVEPALCRDTMTGMPYPDRATLTVGDRTFEGCGGNPEDLLTGGEWVVASVAGQTMPADVLVTLFFDGAGGLGGGAGCNRFATSLTFGGERIEVGPIAATRMLCPEPQMAVEDAFLAALARLARFDIDAAGSLTLYAADSADPILTATRPR